MFLSSIQGIYLHVVDCYNWCSYSNLYHVKYTCTLGPILTHPSKKTSFSHAFISLIFDNPFNTHNMHSWYLIYCAPFSYTFSKLDLEHKHNTLERFCFKVRLIDHMVVNCNISMIRRCEPYKNETILHWWTHQLYNVPN